MASIRDVMVHFMPGHVLASAIPLILAAGHGVSSLRLGLLAERQETAGFGSPWEKEALGELKIHRLMAWVSLVVFGVLQVGFIRDLLCMHRRLGPGWILLVFV